MAKVSTKKPGKVLNRAGTGGAASPGQGNTTAQLIRQANRWRDQYNPLRSLVISRVVAMLEAGERGAYADLQWTYRFVEKRFPVLRSLIARRQAALLKLEWAVKPVEAAKWLEKRGKKAVVSGQRSGVSGQESDGQWQMADGKTYTEAQVQEMGERQAAFLREKYEQITNLKEAIRALSLAEFRGFAMLSKLTKRAARSAERGVEYRPAGVGEVTELHWLPQWNVVRDGLFGEWYWNPEAKSQGASAGLDRVDPSQVICRCVEMPINEIGIVAYLRSNLSQKDWDAFIEIVGLPGGVVIMPPNIPQGKEDEYEDAATAVAEGANGALPNGADIKFPTAVYRGRVPFKEHMEWQEKDVVLAGTGGKLTMLNEATGIGGSQGRVHQDAFDEIATMEAGEISEVFQKQFDAVELAAAFPGEPVLAYFQLQPMDESAQDRLTFKREVFKTWMADGTVSDVLANQTDLKQLTRDVELPVNEEYVDPYLPVSSESGAVTGEVVRDAEGDVVGGQTQAPKTYDQGPRNNQDPTAENGGGPKPEGSPHPGPLAEARPANGREGNRGADGRDTGLQNRAAEVMGVPESWLAPVRDLLAEIEAKAKDRSLSDADLVEFVKAAAKRVPELFGEMDHEALAEVLEKAMGGAVVEGIKGKMSDA